MSFLTQHYVQSQYVRVELHVFGPKHEHSGYCVPHTLKLSHHDATEHIQCNNESICKTTQSKLNFRF